MKDGSLSLLSAFLFFPPRVGWACWEVCFVDSSKRPGLLYFWVTGLNQVTEVRELWEARTMTYPSQCLKSLV